MIPRMTLPVPKDSGFLPRLIGLNLILDIILFDQITKWLAMEVWLKPEGRAPVSLIDWIIYAPAPMSAEPVTVTSFFNIVMVWNRGISFGLFQTHMPLILVGTSLLISAVFGVWLARVRHWPPAIALSLVIGGALGNVIDRVRFGAVADFLDFHWQGWHYPAFNVADAAITCGIALLLIDGVFWEPKRQRVNHG
jgi:signal peptidase II